MESDRKNITVLMTTYNCAPYIGLAIKSILNQTFRNFELLIIDDGSIDNTGEIIKQFEDSRICYVKIDHVGIGAAANVGLKLAKHDWIARIDADDICHPLRLEKQIKYLNDNKFLIVSSFSAYFIKNKLLYITEIGNSSEMIKEQLKLHSVISHQSCIYNKQFILGDLSGYNENLPAYIDYDLWLRSTKKGEFIIVPEVLVFARIRNTSVSNTLLYKNDMTYYNLQNNFFCKDHFYFNDLILQGWREFFYGNPKLVKKYWFRVKFQNWDYRMILAFILSLFPIQLVNIIKKQRIRLRLQYFFSRFAKYKYLKKEFNHLMKIIDRND